MLLVTLDIIAKFHFLDLENKISVQDVLRNVTDLCVFAVTEQTLKSILAELIFKLGCRICLILPLSVLKVLRLKPVKNI